MVDLTLGQTFGTVIAPGSSFQHLITRDELLELPATIVYLVRLKTLIHWQRTNSAMSDTKTKSESSKADSSGAAKSAPVKGTSDQSASDKSTSNARITSDKSTPDKSTPDKSTPDKSTPDKGKSDSGGSSAGKSARDSVGGAKEVHYGYFSNVKTPEYRNGWDAIWANEGNKPKKKSKSKRSTNL